SSDRRSQSLRNLLPELVNECSTVSFFPGSRRVIVVENLSELFNPRRSRSKRKAKSTGGEATASRPPAETAESAFARFVTRTLPETNAVLIFLAFEDEVRGKTVDEKSDLYALFRSEGTIHRFKENPILFRFTDALLARDSVGALDCFRAWYKAGETANQIFAACLKTVRLLLQARIVQARGEAVGSETLDREYFPEDRSQNLFQVHEFVRKKHLKAARLFSTAELQKALEQLLELNRTMYPSGEDLYVADLQSQFEIFLIDFLLPDREKADRLIS
ncbi:MAG: hypothetical protein V2A74_14300, partial [bacterium]